MTDRTLMLHGAPGSPYTRKMLAVLRYRRIPYRLLTPHQAQSMGLPQPKVALLPTFYFTAEDGSIACATDSTPLISRLDAEIAERRVRPADPVLSFLDALIEDYADEWLTKAMFHYRWHFAADADKASTLLPLHGNIAMPQEQADHFKTIFAERQISRLHYVGSSPATAGMIEASYTRFLTILQTILARRPFLAGAAPGAGDFAIYGQLTQLAHFDPTPAALALSLAPRVFAWVHVMEDLSGLDASQASADAETLETLAPLLHEIGRVYAPVLLANEAAASAGQTRFTCTLDGAAWEQNTFPYHRKCLASLRQSYASLSAPQRNTLTPTLTLAGLLPLLTA